MELPAPGIWALCSRLVKSAGFGRPWTRTLALRHRGQEAQKRPGTRGCGSQHSTSSQWGRHCSPPFPCCAPLQIMEVASPTAGSVLVELAQLQLLQACRAVAVRTMSPHGESADSLPAPIAPALAEASWPARVPCACPRPGPEVRPPLAPASPGPGDPSSPLRCPDPRGPQEAPGAPTASPPRETAGGSSEEPPAPVSQVPGWGGGWLAEAGRRVWARGGGPFLSACRSRSRLGRLCWVPLGTGRPPSPPWKTVFLALPPPPWPRRTLSRPQERPAWHAAPPKERWPRGCPVSRPAVEETQGPG